MTMGVVGVPKFVLNPAWYLYAEPPEELQCLHRPAHREGEHDRDRILASGGALVVIVRDKVLCCVDVVDHLGDEEGAACCLLGEQSQMLIAIARMALRDRDPAEQ